MLILTPLLLTTGTWTLLRLEEAIPNILTIPIITSFAEVRLLESLGDIWWPEIAHEWDSRLEGAPANIWKPQFVLAYGLALVVLWNAASNNRTRSRWSAPTLAALVGFLGVLSEELALLSVILWIGLEASYIVPALARHSLSWSSGVISTVGPGTALLLLAVGGGALTATLLGEPRNSISISWIRNPLGRESLGGLESFSPGIGIMGVGAVTASAVAALFALRDRLVLALAIGSFVCMIAALSITYEASPMDVTRFDGHARNFALLALLLAVAILLSKARMPWLGAVAAVVVTLIVWPSIARPARTIALGVSYGVHFSNPNPGVEADDFNPENYDLTRLAIRPLVSGSVVNHIRDRTDTSTRILSPHPVEMSILTGRPNASGLAGHIHLFRVDGAEYTDAIRYLEPRAIRRRGFRYVHATNAWINGLPIHARRWLENPILFERVVQTSVDALYRVQPGFLDLNEIYDLDSYESLRQSIPTLSSVFLAPGILPKVARRIASSLSHTQLFGTLDWSNTHLLTNFSIRPLGHLSPDFVAIPTRQAPAAFSESSRLPIWWSSEVAVYAVDGTTTPLSSPPRQDFSIRVSDVQIAKGRIAFTATFTDRASHLWQGQDWVVVETDDSPWRLPYRFGTATYTSVFVRWFDGQVQPVPETDTHEYLFLYEFEPRTGTLALWDGSGYSSLSQAQPQLRPGNWMLAARPNINREEVGLIPVLQFTLTEDGDFTYKVYEGSLDAMLVR